MKNIIVFLLSLIPLSSVADEKPVHIEMEGVIKVWGKQTPESEITGLSVFIRGKAAEKLFKDMKAHAVHNECFDDGTLTKQLGNFECSYSEKYQYSCSVGIGISEQKLFYSEAC